MFLTKKKKKKKKMLNQIQFNPSHNQIQREASITEKSEANDTTITTKRVSRHACECRSASNLYISSLMRNFYLTKSDFRCRLEA